MVAKGTVPRKDAVIGHEGFGDKNPNESEVAMAFMSRRIYLTRTSLSTAFATHVTGDTAVLAHTSLDTLRYIMGYSRFIPHQMTYSHVTNTTVFCDLFNVEYASQVAG